MSVCVRYYVQRYYARLQVYIYCNLSHNALQYYIVAPAGCILESCLPPSHAVSLALVVYACADS